jgi:5-formyltetrahydrofolate cyclo-ligase
MNRKPMGNQYKDALRTTMKQARGCASVSYRMNASKQVCHRLSALELYQQAKHVALYAAINGEIDLTLLWENALREEKVCYFPVLNDDLTLSFLPATPTTPFKTNRFGISEPDVGISSAIPIEQLELIVVPMVAFDIQCSRLGMGSGYYDRTLANKRNGHFIGVAYQFQLTSLIKPEPWDIPLDAVVTHQAIYWRNPLK